MGRNRFGKHFPWILGRRLKISLSFITIWLNGVALLMLWTAILWLFCLMVFFYPTRGLLIVLFLMFLALIGFLCP